MMNGYPVITKKIQKAFEERCNENMEALKLLPDICGIYGRGCLQMGKSEGCNHALCSSCPLAEFADSLRMKRVCIDGEVLVSDDGKSIDFMLVNAFDRCKFALDAEEGEWIDIYCSYFPGSPDKEEQLKMELHYCAEGSRICPYTPDRGERDVIIDALKRHLLGAYEQTPSVFIRETIREGNQYSDLAKKIVYMLTKKRRLTQNGEWSEEWTDINKIFGCNLPSDSGLLHEVEEQLDRNIIAEYEVTESGIDYRFYSDYCPQIET